MDSFQIGWHQGEVSNTINYLVSTNPGVYVFVVSRSHLMGVCFLYKQFWNVCHIRPLYLSGNWEFCDSAVWQIYSLNCYQFSSPIAILCFYIFTFPNC